MVRNDLSRVAQDARKSGTGTFEAYDYLSCKVVQTRMQRWVTSFENLAAAEPREEHNED